MEKAIILLQRFGLLRPKVENKPTAFDLRVQKLGGVHKVSVARAVLFRTRLSH